METWKIVFLIILAALFISFLIVCYSLIKLVKENVGKEISEINTKLQKRLNIMISMIIVITVAGIVITIFNSLLWAWPLFVVMSSYS